MVCVEVKRMVWVTQFVDLRYSDTACDIDKCIFPFASFLFHFILSAASGIDGKRFGIT